MLPVVEHDFCSDVVLIFVEFLMLRTRVSVLKLKEQVFPPIGFLNLKNDLLVDCV